MVNIPFELSIDSRTLVPLNSAGSVVERALAVGGIWTLVVGPVVGIAEPGTEVGTAVAETGIVVGIAGIEEPCSSDETHWASCPCGNCGALHRRLPD